MRACASAAVATVVVRVPGTTVILLGDGSDWPVNKIPISLVFTPLNHCPVHMWQIVSLNDSQIRNTHAIVSDKRHECYLSRLTGVVPCITYSKL